ncbi:hypothetical protein ACQ4PT_011373 [Festuca glaucescens]
MYSSDWPASTDGSLQQDGQLPCRPHGRPPRGDSLPSPGQIGLPFQVRLSVLARPHQPPRPPQEAPTDSLRLLQPPHQPGGRAPFRQYLLFLRELDSILGGEEQHVSDPSLSFLPGYTTVCPLDCCNGLLLCLCSKDTPSNERNYVVCNPATEKWLILPDSGRHNEVFARRLCFDPAISSRFHVFSILEDVDDYITDVEIYSSEAGEWSHKENGWSQVIMLYDRSVFLNGMLYFISYDSAVVTVGKEGKAWKTIPLLETMTVEISLVSNEALIGQSQGRLHYMNVRDRDPSTLSVWILDSYHSGKWIFKYNISTSKLFGHKGFRLSQNYTLIAIHPDCNLIFVILNGENLLLSYDMDRGKVRVIHNLKDHFDERYNPYLPYVPLFT